MLRGAFIAVGAVLIESFSWFRYPLPLAVIASILTLSVVTSLRVTRGTVHVVSEIKPILLPAARCRRRLGCLAPRSQSERNADQSERQGPGPDGDARRDHWKRKGPAERRRDPDVLHTFPDLPGEPASSWPSVISRCVGRWGRSGG
ncbi:hypothetical protein RPIT_03675 [Tessaracoccus flavus]|uniref:Uncharacterized protein n=1 Tax=Tessaracoccus flavus TaxID=1610493 RepID=A0A1Q2CD22_9ACTN|nr:hypothetical protein RPIT_03675 [Tessaracoccus flavus]